jgi:hypothetical protein
VNYSKRKQSIVCFKCGKPLAFFQLVEGRRWDDGLHREYCIFSPRVMYRVYDHGDTWFYCEECYGDWINDTN